MKAISKLWSILLRITRFTVYPIHLLYRVMVRCFHLFAMLSMFFVIPIISIIVFTYMYGNWNTLMTTVLFVEGELILWILSFVSLGGLAYIIRFSREAITRHIFDFVDTIKTFYGWNRGPDGWIPGLEVGKSILDTGRRHFMKILPSIKNILISSVKFNLALFFLTISLLFSYIPIKNDHDWKSNVSRGLDQLRNFIVFTQEGTTYPLVFSDHANLSTKDGICPVKSNFDWLKQFKEAISNCSKKGKRPSVLVQGFSSVAPISTHEEYNGLNSDRLNCEVANLRAEAVVGLLISDLKSDSKPIDQCVEAMKIFDDIRTKDLCERNKREFRSNPEDHNINFDITYIPWKSYDDMSENKPANDGTILHRKRKVEFLNRVVYITITNDACWK